MYKTLIGEDGYLAKGVLGTEVVGDGTTMAIAKGTWVQITGKASSNSGFGGLAVGQFYYAPIAIVAAELPTGDKWKVLTLTKFADGVSWSVEIAADEIDVTVNALRFKSYRRGKLDANGNASFLFTMGVTDEAGGLAEKFFDIVSIDATGAATVTKADSSSIYLVGYLHEGKEKVDENRTLATVMNVELFNFALPSNMGEAATLDIPFRLVGQNDPVIYKIELPVV
jgi:hypothetical protein